MFKKIVSIILALAAVLCLFSSCGKGEGKDLYYPIYADPVSFDPQIAADNASKIVVYNCFEGLVRADRDGSILPGVAQNWKVSADGLTYTFYLRDDAKWYMSDYAGKLLTNKQLENFNYNVTADDFVYGLERAFDASMGSVTDTRLFSIVNSYDVFKGEMSPDNLGVKAIDSKTLEIRLTEPHSDFLNALTQTAAMPCREEFFLATKGRYGLDPEKVIYNGPFYLYSWSIGSNLVLVKNESYAGEREVKPACVNLYINNDLNTRIDKITDGTYDACPISIRQKASIEEKDITYTAFDNTTWGVAFNCLDEELMSNHNLRCAISNALDIKSIPLPKNCKTYANGIIPDICMAGGQKYRSYASSVSVPSPNKTKAVAYLEAAFDELEKNNVSVEVLCLDTYKDSAKLAIQSLQKNLGVHINFKLIALDEVSLDNRFKTGDYQMAFTKITAESESAISFLNLFTSNSQNNFFGFKSALYDSLLGVTSENFSQQKSISNCIKAEQQLINESVFIPMFSEESYLALANGVEGIYSVEAGCVPIFYDGIRK